MSDAKDYITKREIPQLFECLMTGLMYHRPSDHVSYLQECLGRISQHGVSTVRWDLFLESKRTKTPLPPVTPTHAASSRGSSRSASALSDKKVLPPIGSSGSPPPPAPRPSSPLPELPLPLRCPLLLLLGAPGSGKRQLCRDLASRHGYDAICVGDLLRRRLADSDDSDECVATARAKYAEGDYASDDLLLRLLLQEMAERLAAGSAGFVVEGFPRNEEQMAAFRERTQRLDHAMLVDFDEPTLEERLMSRAHAAADAGDGADASRERPAAAARRLSLFKSHTLPLCRQLEEEGKLLLVMVKPGTEEAAAAAAALAALDSEMGKDAGSQQQQQQKQQQQKKEQEKEKKDAKDEKPKRVFAPVTRIRQLQLPADLISSSSSSSSSSRRQPVAVALALGGPGSRRTQLARCLCRHYEKKVAIVSATDDDADADADADLYGAGDAEKIAAKIRAAAAAGAACVVVEGFPVDEEGLRRWYGAVGSPDLCLLVDCDEEAMLRRLLGDESDDAAQEAASRRMRFFVEETLPVVRHLDEAGKLCILLGDRDESEVTNDMVALFDSVFFGAKLEPQLAEQWPAAAAAREKLQSGAGEQQPASGSSFTEEEQEAATKIQAGFRGFKTRREMAGGDQ